MKNVINRLLDRYASQPYYRTKAVFSYVFCVIFLLYTWADALMGVCETENVFFTIVETAVFTALFCFPVVLLVKNKLNLAVISLLTISAVKIGQLVLSPYGLEYITFLNIFFMGLAGLAALKKRHLLAALLIAAVSLALKLFIHRIPAEQLYDQKGTFIIMYFVALVCIYLFQLYAQRETETRMTLLLKERDFSDLISNIRGIIYKINHKGESIILKNEECIRFDKTNSRKKQNIMWEDHVHPGDLKYYQKASQELIEKQGNTVLRYRILDIDGNIHFIEDHRTCAPSDHGLILSGIIFDVTKQVETRNKLITNEKLLKQIFNIIRDPIRLLDKDHSVIITNTQYDEILKSLDKHNMDGPHDFLCNEYKAINSCTLERILKGEPVVEEELTLMINGEKHYYQIAALPFNNQDDKPIGSLEIMHDITKEVTDKQRLIELRNQAEEASQAKTTFLARVSHELRTPLNAIIGFSSLLEASEKNEENRETIELITNSGRRLLLMVSDLLDLSNINAGELDRIENVFSLEKLIERLYATFLMKADEKKIQFMVDFGKEIPPLLIGDDLHLEQILSNLIDNAIKFTQKGSVSLSLRRYVGNSDSLENILFTVNDTGSGISEANLERIFHQFSQEEGYLSREHEGSGLGLAITRDLVKHMDGTIDVESEKDKGSTFSIILPFKKLNVAPVDESFSETDTEEIVSEKTSFGLLLVAEDETIKRLVSQTAKLKKWKLTIANDGNLAVAFSKAISFGAILVDKQATSARGQDTIQGIRENNSGIPIISITNEKHATDSSVSEEAGRELFLVKPFTIDELIYIVSSIT